MNRLRLRRSIRSLRLFRLMPVALAAVALVVAFAGAPASAGSGANSTTGQFDPKTQGGLPNVDNPGKYLFEQGCSTCHGVDGKGSKLAPTLIGVGSAAVDFYVSSGRMPLNQPVVQAPRKRPAYSQKQIDAMASYVASLAPPDQEGPGTPLNVPSSWADLPSGNGLNGQNGQTSPGQTSPGHSSDLVTGNELYSNNCAACHNSAGSGGALGRNYYAPNLYDATPRQIAEALRIGPGSMPQFGPNQLSDSQVNDIVSYVGNLHSSDNRGGLALGHVGPIPEGFFAWVVGLGFMLVIARWIGTRV